jgi:two-component system sensor kinase FixL
VSELAIQKSESWLRNLVVTTQDALVSIDRRGCIVLFNASAERIFGYTAEEIVGRRVNLLMAEPYAREHDDYIDRYEKTGEARAIGRIRTVTARRKSGELFPIELSVTEIGSDEEVHYAAFIRDISDKVKLQAQLVESERLAAIGTMAAKFGHELGNPLNGMSLTIQLLEQRLARPTASPEKQVASTVSRLKSEIARLNLLLRDFRALSRREKFNFRGTSVQGLVTEALELELPRLKELGVEVRYEFPERLPEIAVDADKMKQVILNLVNNSVDAMPQGGKLIVKATTSDDAVVFEISDTGHGIPPDVDVFESFFTTKPYGTGIGLAVVREIVRGHGGTVSYRSEPGSGTSFFITLPHKKVGP